MVFVAVKRTNQAVAHSVNVFLIVEWSEWSKWMLKVVVKAVCV